MINQSDMVKGMNWNYDSAPHHGSDSSLNTISYIYSESECGDVTRENHQWVTSLVNKTSLFAINDARFNISNQWGPFHQQVTMVQAIVAGWCMYLPSAYSSWVPVTNRIDFNCAMVR